MESSTEPTLVTATQHEQWMVEGQCFQIYGFFSDLPRRAQSVMLEIQRDNHLEYLTRGLQHLGSSFVVLDANRPWLCYWIIHSIALLGQSISEELESNTIDFLSRCQDANGGYGGGPGQMPHLATTYAAVNSLITLGGSESFSSINRDQIYNFLLRIKDAILGGFRMHEGGEMDVRACYTAISVASLLNILDYKLVQNVGDYILSCQTYEGGIAGEPGSEAHGGYTYCGLATMVLIGEVHRLDLTTLIDWMVFRQGRECGFQGRTNKLVDGCYSFWQGGACALLQRLESIINEQLVMGVSTTSDTEEGINYSSIGYKYIEKEVEMEASLFHSMALQQYILLCSQVQEGGFKDKPGKHRDFYHTCYCLSGLSVSQYCSSSTSKGVVIHGPHSNLLEAVHPLYNVVLDKYHEAHQFFSR